MISEATLIQIYIMFIYKIEQFFCDSFRAARLRECSRGMLGSTVKISTLANNSYNVYLSLAALLL